MASNRSMSLIAVMLATLAVIALAALLAWQHLDRPPGSRSGEVRGGAGEGILTASVNIGGPFALTDHMGKRVTDRDFRGRYMLIYFGYGYCPDVCPTELQHMALAMDELGAAAKDVQPIFITVDPERDTVDFLDGYVGHYHPDLVGLTGSREEIAEAARAYRVFFAKAKDESATEYLMDHSTFVYLMGPDGRFLTLLRGGTSPAAIADAIRSHMEAAPRASG